ITDIIFNIKHVKSKEMNISNSRNDKATLYERLREHAKGYEITFSVLNNITRTSEKIYNQDDYEEQLMQLVDLTNQKVKDGKVDNALGFMIYVIREKEKEVEQGGSPFIHTLETNEIIPEWFKERKQKKAVITSEENE